MNVVCIFEVVAYNTQETNTSSDLVELQNSPKFDVLTHRGVVLDTYQVFIKGTGGLFYKICRH